VAIAHKVGELYEVCAVHPPHPLPPPHDDPLPHELPLLPLSELLPQELALLLQELLLLLLHELAAMYEYPPPERARVRRACGEYRSGGL
jgi:hypothetical protein